MEQDQRIADVVAVSLPTPTRILACQDINPNQVITVSGHVKITPNCDLQGKSVRFILDSSDTSLDCSGARLSVGGKGDTQVVSAITVQPKTDEAISNITVANCHTAGYGHALHIRQKTNPNVRYNAGFTDPDANRALAPSQIDIINVSSVDSVNSGIFVGDHVTHVNFDNLYVARSGTVGLYFEFGSQFNKVENSVFIGNGFRSFKPNREAIAIDSSGYNYIADNEFIHNGAGAVHLYRNCFEHANDPSQSNYFKRTESASRNIITRNTFREEPVGVWVASRQSRNLKGFECGAYLLAQTPFARYHVDSAQDNEISHNTFIDTDIGIIVEDDGTSITFNDFTQIQGTPYTIGSSVRERYADNIDGLNPQITRTEID